MTRVPVIIRNRRSGLRHAVDAKLETLRRRIDRHASVAETGGKRRVVRDGAQFHAVCRLLADLDVDGTIGCRKERELAGRLEVVPKPVDGQHVRIAVAAGALPAASWRPVSRS